MDDDFKIPDDLLIELMNEQQLEGNIFIEKQEDFVNSEDKILFEKEVISAIDADDISKLDELKNISLLKLLNYKTKKNVQSIWNKWKNYWLIKKIIIAFLTTMIVATPVYLISFPLTANVWTSSETIATIVLSGFLLLSIILFISFKFFEKNYNITSKEELLNQLKQQEIDDNQLILKNTETIINILEKKDEKITENEVML
jgi:hypothetical protein